MDVVATYTKAAIAKVAGDREFTDRIRTRHPVDGDRHRLENALPDVVADRHDMAYKLVQRFLTETFGEARKAGKPKSS